MKIGKELDELLQSSECIGTFFLSDLVSVAEREQSTGLAVSRGGDRVFYLALLAGEPEGAVYSDENGELYGDKAAVRFTGKEQFAFHRFSGDIISALIMGCRIFEKSHLKKSLAAAVPEVGKKTDGVGILMLTIRQDGVPRNGFRVTIRKVGSITGSDITTGSGNVSFRLLYGVYDCIVQDRTGLLRTFSLTFDAAHSAHILDI